MLERLRIDGFARNFEIELRAKDGRLIPHLFSATVVNVAGEPCVIAIVHDISPLKQTERRAYCRARDALGPGQRSLTQERLRAEIAEREAGTRRCRKANNAAQDFRVQPRQPSRQARERRPLLDVNNAFATCSATVAKKRSGKARRRSGNLGRYRKQLREPSPRGSSWKARCATSSAPFA